METKIISKWHIEWTGIKSVLIHSAWIAGISVATYLLHILGMHDFGTYTPIAVWVIGTASAFLKKLCEKYQVKVPEY